MPEKIPGEIRKIQLSGATFRGTQAFLEPTYVNFIFGGNGTGKSTIAKAIQSGTGVTYAPGKSSADYLALVFNQEFINRNVASYRSLNGVFTINEVNVKIQEQIDKKTEQQTTARQTATSATEERDKRIATKAALQKQFYKDCWDKTEDLRGAFDATQDGKRKAKQLAEAITSYEPVEHDLPSLRLMYDAAYSDDAKRYERFTTIADVKTLDILEGSDILGIVIANAAETDFASFLKEIEATEWFRQSHETFHGKTDGKCPYCARDLQDDFEKTVTASFDDKYAKNIQGLNDFYQAYRNAANALIVPISKVPNEIFPAIDIKAFQDKLAAAKAIIAENLATIQEKINEPSKIVALKKTETSLQELSDVIAGYNALIDKNNTIVDDAPRKRKQCRDQVFEYMAFRLKDVIEGYGRSDTAIDNEITAQQKTIDAQNAMVTQLDKELGDLRSQTVDTEKAIININNMLRDAGFEGFEVSPRKERILQQDGTTKCEVEKPVRNYEVIRTETGEIAEDLSEGEKNFIAFLYFQQVVFGSSSAEGDTRQKIVVIDDPVSSMDSSALFIIGEQVRKMVEICRNNADDRDPVMKGKFIKQIFILTHNPYFHREVSYPYADRYEFVSFYLVKKRGNKSSVELKRVHNPDCPTEWINKNPVQNSYAALWAEYKELIQLEGITSSVPFMNVVRRILEYYFLQLCGYDGSHLRTIILEQNKDYYTHDATGNEDDAKFDMAKAMLHYISASAYGVNDGLHYVDDAFDIEVCKETFHSIFRHMQQEQHYNMMMNNK